MDILMYGVGRGANIQKWIDFFQSEKDLNLTFICNRFEFNTNEYSKIKIIEVKSWKIFFCNFQFLFAIFFKKHDLFLLQGLYGSKYLLRILLCNRSKLKVLHIWNTRNYKKALQSNTNFIERKIFKNILRKFDLIYFNTKTLHNRFVNNLPHLHKKCKTADWGSISEKYLQDNYTNHSKKVTDIISKLPANKLILFMGREFAPSNRQDLLIKSIIELKKNGLSRDIFLLLMPGLNSDLEYSKKLEELVKNNDIQDNIFIVRETLTHQEYSAIIENISVLFSIVNFDQWSFSMIEAMSKKIPIVISKIPEYINYVNEFNYDVVFTDNTVSEIAKTIECLLSKKCYINHDKNMQIIKREAIFEKNQKNKFEYLKKILIERKDV